MLLTIKASQLKPGDIRHCGRVTGRQRVKGIEPVQHGFLTVRYTAGWGHLLRPDTEVQVER